MIPPPDDNPNTKPPEEPSGGDPFDNLLSGGGGDALNLDAAAALSGKISGGLGEGGDTASAVADASKLAEALTAGVGASVPPETATETETATSAEVPPPPPGDADEGAVKKDGEEAEQSKARAAAEKVNSYIKARKDTWSDYALVFTGWRSADRLTARMSVLFIVCFVGTIYVLTTAWKRHSITAQEIQRREFMMRTAQQNELAKKLADEEKLRSSIVTMGKFTLELNPIAGQRLNRGVVNMAEVEIVLRCDSKATREYIETHFTHARSLLVTALVAMDREELLSHDGKKKWKAILMKVLNQWLKEGQVEDLYFARLLVN